MKRFKLDVVRCWPSAAVKMGEWVMIWPHAVDSVEATEIDANDSASCSFNLGCLAKAVAERKKEAFMDYIIGHEACGGLGACQSAD